MTKTPLALALGLALCAAAPAPADDPKGAIPADAADPAFDKYLDLKALSQALADRKPDAVAGCALKLAEGERALSRKHKAVNSEKLLRLAVDFAHDKRDKETLGRIGKAAKEAKNEDLISLVETTQKLVDLGRKVDPDAAAVEQASPAHAVVFRSLTEEIRAAKSLANRGEIDGLEKTIGKLDPYDSKLKAMLLKQVAAARKALPPKDDPDMDVLARLASASRSTKGGGAFVTMEVTLENATKETIEIIYAEPLGQKAPGPLGADQKKTYSLQFVKGKPAAVKLGKGEAVTVEDKASYRIEKGGEGLVLKPAKKD
jgi:hypothetical protein